MAQIILKGVYKRWGTAEALSNINFICENGTLLVLLGPSGCGKSTTLRLIAGLDTPSSGSVEIGGRDVSNLPPVKRQISMVFQNYALFPHLNVAENILFGLKARRVPKAEQTRRLADAAGLLGLTRFLNRKPAQLSGGQRQRVALGRSIVAQVSVCLMDEPLSNLDAKLRQEMRQEIRALQQRLKMTMIYVTHDQVEAMTIADRIILMKDGGIEQHGTPEELYNLPVTAFTGSFIGNPPMNILEMNQRLAKAFASLMMIKNGRDILMGIRPEEIRVIAGSQAAQLEANVDAVEYLGADSLIIGKLGGQNITVSVKGKTDILPGDRLRLGWKEENIHLFDKQTGQRITSTKTEVKPETGAEIEI